MVKEYPKDPTPHVRFGAKKEEEENHLFEEGHGSLHEHRSRQYDADNYGCHQNRLVRVHNEQFLLKTGSRSHPDPPIIQEDLLSNQCIL